MIKIDQKELKDIFNQLKTGNSQAFEKLYTKYNKLVYGIAFSILKNKTDAEDIVQIVYSKIYEMKKEKLPIDKEASWLYSITKNETITYIRKKQNLIDIEEIYNIEDESQELNKLIDKESYNKLISKLNEKEKQIVSLKILGGFSFKEISKLLNEPSGTIKWRYYKALHEIKILLSNLGMFIITFVIGLKTLYKKEKNTTEEMPEENETEQNTMEEVMEDTTKSENSEQNKEVLEFIDKAEQGTVIEKEPEPEQNTLNYYGVGMLGISAIFLITTITCIIFSIKRQKTNIQVKRKVEK